jgi:Arc/MetJ-type ribon-helix-helix transcriptional regulator
MVRIQVQLHAAQHKQVKRRAKELGVSVSEVIRRSVQADLTGTGAGSRADLARRALDAAGRHADPRGPGRTAEQHDAALAEAYKR